MEVVVTQNEARKRFEAEVNNKLALIEYIKTKDKIYLTHTEVPNELEGQGIASSMVKQVLNRIREQELALIPLCPFVAGYVNRHPEYASLLAKGYNV
ncbi:GNAT family N-acetyltransferase [Candidatus Ulvibacter alkanivorans]|uniref:GNAT family N-acetyltransferase n=1 Tax=Candidatus Ulvibacter alkanivorans TaxID=2267620 RepID=UPI000DF2CE74|nr:GNAT family N-acetyltransferase [Candidatus Ulvibacter alkanivorans]